MEAILQSHCLFVKVKRYVTDVYVPPTIVEGHYVSGRCVHLSVPYQVKVFGYGSLPLNSCGINCKLGAFDHYHVNFFI